MIFDPISDMLTRIRNASRVKKEEVVLPFSKIKMKLAETLTKEGYLKRAEKAGGKIPHLKVYLKYDEGGLPVINEIKRVSKPGRRIYMGREELSRFAGRGGIKIVSTSRGIMTDIEAKKEKIGGEVICEIN